MSTRYGFRLNRNVTAYRSPGCVTSCLLLVTMPGGPVILFLLAGLLERSQPHWHLHWTALWWGLGFCAVIWWLGMVAVYGVLRDQAERRRAALAAYEASRRHIAD